jgi:hypothetical protein
MNCGSRHARRGYRRLDFLAGKRRSGNDRASGGLSGDGRRGRRGHYDARLLPGQGNDSSRRGRRRRGGTLTLATQIRTQLAG